MKQLKHMGEGGEGLERNTRKTGNWEKLKKGK